MTRERAEELVSDLLDACVDYEHATNQIVEKVRRDFHQKREAMIDMLSMATERGASCPS